MGKVYNYDPDSGVYMSESIADIDPLDGGFLIPAYATDRAPPKIKENEIAVFASGKWLKQARPVAPVPTIEQLRESASSKISAWRDAQENGSLIFEHAGRRWDGGKAVRERLQPFIGAMQVVGDIPGFIWTTADNENVPMTLKDLMALAAAHDVALAFQGGKIHERQQQMKLTVAQMDAKQLAAFVPGWE